jgi:hypothetical protein
MLRRNEAVRDFPAAAVNNVHGANSRILVEDVRGAAFTGKSRLRERLSREIARRKQSSGYLGVQATPQASDELGFRHRLAEQKALTNLTADRL